jgi:hypothetical protein
MAEALEDALLLTFRASQFDETQAAFLDRLGVYQDDAVVRTASITDATKLAAAQLGWAKYRAYSDMLEVVRERLTSVQNDGEGQVSFTDVGSRLKDIREARDEALAEYQSAVVVEAETFTRRGSVSTPIVSEW